MEPKNGGLEDDVPDFNWVIFRGVIFISKILNRLSHPKFPILFSSSEDPPLGKKINQSIFVAIPHVFFVSQPTESHL